MLSSELCPVCTDSPRQANAVLQSFASGDGRKLGLPGSEVEQREPLGRRDGAALEV